MEARASAVLTSIREQPTNEERLLLALGEARLRKRLPVGLLDAVAGIHGPLTSVDVARLTLVVHAEDTLHQFREDLRERWPRAARTMGWQSGRKDLCSRSGVSCRIRRRRRLGATRTRAGGAWYARSSTASRVSTADRDRDRQAPNGSEEPAVAFCRRPLVPVRRGWRSKPSWRHYPRESSKAPSCGSLNPKNCANRPSRLGVTSGVA